MNQPRMKKLFHREGLSAISSLLPYGPQRSSIEPLDLGAFLVQDYAGFGALGNRARGGVASALEEIFRHVADADPRPFRG
jgi:hypothetical protein